MNEPDQGSSGAGASPDDPDSPEATAWKRLVDRGTGAVKSGRSTAESLLEKHRDRPLLDVGIRLYERDKESAGTVVSSAIAFRLFLFFVPLLLFAVGVAGFIFSAVTPPDASDAGVSGGLATQINDALSQPQSTRWIAVAVGLFGMISTARTLTKTLVAASCLAWRLPVHRKASAKITGAIVGLIAGVALMSVIVNRVREDLGLAFASMSFAVALCGYTVAWLLVGLMLPRATKDKGAALPGAVLVGLTLVGMQAVSQLYLPSKFSRASQLYGAIGTTIVVLGWFFILGRAIMFGLTVDAVIFERFGSITEFVFSLPGLRAVRRRSPRTRRFFGLDTEATDTTDARDALEDKPTP